jgi:MHS family shikimate/dehydroshikimate transporter-like MFS transporter
MSFEKKGKEGSKLGNVVIASSIGSYLEWYDFFIAGTAASLVWPRVFFNPNNPTLAAALSTTLFAIIYIVRPVGAIIFGHLGDKYGRKNTFVLTLILMFIGTLGIGLTPNYETIGIIAPILIILFRIIQGIGFGGEWGGAASFLGEHAIGSKFQPLIITLGTEAATIVGTILASGAFSLVISSMPFTSFVTLGWRILFFTSAITLIAGIIIRYKLRETPLFQSIVEKREIARSPVLEVFKKQWKVILMLAVIETVIVNGTSGVTTPYTISLLTARGISPSFSTISVTIANVVTLIMVILISYIISLRGSRGKKVVIWIGYSLTALFLPFYFILINTLDYLLILLAIIVFTIFQRIGDSVTGPLIAEQFPTKYRYSGTSLSYQISALIAGLNLGVVQPALIGSFGILGSFSYVLLTYAIITVLGILCAIGVKEVKFRTNEEV